LAVARKHIQPDTPAPPNRIAAGPSDLKVVGRREYNNVMRKTSERKKRMKNKTIILTIIFLVVILVIYRGYDYYNDHFVNKRIMENIMNRENYTIYKNEDAINIKLFIKPEWIPFEKGERKKLNIQLTERNNTNIILQDVWNRGNDIYFSFHTTYNLDYKKGKFLYNMIFNDDGTYTNTGSFNDYQLLDTYQNAILIGQTGSGPESDFSFGIEPNEYDKIRKGFTINYSGMILYEYSRK
jgi:hypothetical protein